MEPTINKSTNRSSILWVLVILLVGAAAGVGGYFLGKNNAKTISDDNSATSVSIENETGDKDFCTHGYCITYDQSRWFPTSDNEVDQSKPGGGINLAIVGSDEDIADITPQDTDLYFSTFVDGLGGTCEPQGHSCYYLPIEIKAHPNIKDFFIVKMLTYTRDSGGQVYSVHPGLYVIDQKEVNKLDLEVDKEKKDLFWGLFDTGRRHPEHPEDEDNMNGWLRFGDTESQSIQDAKQSLVNGPYARDAYKVLSSLRKQ